MLFFPRPLAVDLGTARLPVDRDWLVGHHWYKPFGLDTAGL